MTSKKLLFVRILAAAGIVLTGLTACTNFQAPTEDPGALIAEYDQALALFDQITVGMSYEQALQLLGTPEPPRALPTSSSGAQAEIPGPLGYQWKFNQASEIVGGSISYRIDPNGDIGEKTFTWNLFSPAFQQDALTTPERYDTVQLGMSYEQVVEALGSPGRFFMIREDLLPMAPLVGNMQTGWAFLHGDRVSMDVFWWPENAKNAGDAMKILFINNEVTSKSYLGETITQ